MTTGETVDVLIVGAGLSGVAAAYYLGERCPRKSWAIVEARDAIGGTWDFFTYPGIRSDSDMFTLGYRFRPWQGRKAIADGPAILQYIKDTARDCGIDKKIRFGHRVHRVSWRSDNACWDVDIQRAHDSIRIRCKFLFMCTGYYRYDAGYAPRWPGMDDFAGPIIHPQAWPDTLDYAGKRVVVIGSGATAVTMIPALAERAAHVTMLQRSPSYIVSGPSEDASANWLRERLPLGFGAWLNRWRYILRSLYYFQIARRKPQATRDGILAGARTALGPDYDVDTHFGPSYNPWDQRVCLAADADLFKAINAGRASVVTDSIDRFVVDGLLLQSGDHLQADIIVTATGLRMKLMHGMDIIVDGQQARLGDTLSYKGLMYSGIPNLASAFGYTNASWTLKCELICEYVCRLLRYMERREYDFCVPRVKSAAIETEEYIDFTSGYVRRALDDLPKQGKHPPWKVHQNYLKDLLTLRYGRLNDGQMEFRRLKRP